MTENQKLREALRIAVNYIDMDALYTSAGSDHDAIKEAIALPTAAPVGERAEFEKHMSDKFGYDANDFERVEGGSRYLMGGLENHFTTWQARASLQSGTDAVDAGRYRLLRRGQHWSVINGIGDTLRGDDLDAAIDAAISRGEGE